MSSETNYEENQEKSNVIEMPVGELMKKNYLNYAVSVIMDRALPDVRDGLKPVHRRILYAMYQLKMFPGAQYQKSARIVGEVMGKYHPHGDSAIYEAAVYMAQPWSKRVPLIDGQGNFGSIDGDSPAAMRYTEAKLTKAGAAFFEDIDKETVTFRENYSGTEKEPEVLPVSYPNIWVNGVEGIAVGMATNVPPHNLNETIDVTLELQKNPDLKIEEILKIMPAPDFPTGGIVHDLSGYKNALETGKGLVRVRSKWHVETNNKGYDFIIVDELPFKVNKKELIENIYELVKNKEPNLEEIIGIHDETNKEGIRIVIALKKGAIPNMIFNHLIKKTQIEKSYSYNVMLLEGQMPKQMGLVEILTKFLQFRTEIIEKKIQFELKKASEKLHILSGVHIVLNQLQKALDLIMEKNDTKSANEALCIAFEIDEIQAQAILDMKLQKLTGMEINTIKQDFENTTDKVNDLKDLLTNPIRVQEIVKKDLLLAKERFGEARKTEISYENNDILTADLIKKEECLIHITKNGYLKRVSLDHIEAQKRNGKGRTGIQTNEDDYVEAIYSASTHDLFMIFTETGKVMANRVWKLPDGIINPKGRHLRNIFNTLNEPVANILIIPEIEEGWSVITVTAKGKVKRTLLTEYTGSLRKKGVQGVSIDEGDRLISVSLAKDNDNLLIVSSKGKVVRFEVNDQGLRSKGRNALGVKGIGNKSGEVVSAIILPQNEEQSYYLLCVGENGVGKRTSVDEFDVHARGGSGVSCFNINEKTGNIVKAILVRDDEDVMLATASKTLRIAAHDVRITGRKAAGTLLMNVGEEKLIDLIKVPKNGEDAELTNEQCTELNKI